MAKKKDTKIEAWEDKFMDFSRVDDPKRAKVPPMPKPKAPKTKKK